MEGEHLEDLCTQPAVPRAGTLLRWGGSHADDAEGRVDTKHAPLSQLRRRCCLAGRSISGISGGLCLSLCTAKQLIVAVVPEQLRAIGQMQLPIAAQRVESAECVTIHALNAVKYGQLTAKGRTKEGTRLPACVAREVGSARPYSTYDA